MHSKLNLILLICPCIAIQAKSDCTDKTFEKGEE